MEKSKVINGLINEIREKKVVARRLLDSKDPRLNSTVEEIKNLEGSLYQLLDFYGDDGNEKDNVFIDVLKAFSGAKKISDSDQVIINFLREAAGEDGGFLVPSDIQVQVKKARQDETNLEEFVNIELVHSNKGSRTYEVRAENTPFEIVLEGDAIPETEEDSLREVKYEIKKSSGIIKVTNELFNDSNKAVLLWLKTWLAKKSRAGRNKAIITKINEMTLDKEVKVDSAEDVKVIFNKSLDAAYSREAIVLTNMSGYDFLDGLYDSKGNKVLESDIANREKLLFGLYPVKRVSDKLLKNKEVIDAEENITAVKYPIICGNLREAITLFDREILTVELSGQGSTFFSDHIKIKGRDRFDVQKVDEDAVIMAYAEVTA